MMVNTAECDFALIVFATGVAKIKGEDRLNPALINHVVEGRDRKIDSGCVVAKTKDTIHLPVGGTWPCHSSYFCEVLLHDRKLANSQCLLGHETSSAVFLIIYLKRGAVLLIGA